MAARFWVTGGTGNWNSTTNWSATSGGASGASVPGSADTATLNASSGSGTVTLDISPTIQTLTCTGFTGTLAFGTNTISLNSTGTIFTGATTMTVTGTPLIICTSSTTTLSRTISPTAVTEANSISFRITAGTAALSLTSGNYRDIDLTDGVNPTGYAGALTLGINSYYGNFKASTGMTVVAGTSALTFAATSGTKTINTAGVTFDRPFTFNGVGGTFQLASNLTSGATRTLTLTAGTLDLASFTASTGFFNSNVSTIRTLAFGTGKMVLTGNSGNAWLTTTGTNLTITGSKRVELTYSGSTGTRTVGGPTTATTIEGVNLADFYVTAGSDIVTFSNSRSVGTIDFSNAGTSTFTGTATNATWQVYGNLVFKSGMTVGSGANIVSLFATSGTKNITSNGQTLNFPMVINGPGGTFQFSDAFVLDPSRSLSFTAGTLNTNGYSVGMGVFISNNSNTRALNLGASLVAITGTGTVWDLATSTGMTLNAGTSTITTSGSSAVLTFNGGGLTYYNVTFGATYYNNALTGTNTFNNLTIASPAAAGRRALTFNANQTINGTLTAVGSAANTRPRLTGNVVGGVTITAAAVSLTDTDFVDIIAAGASIPWSGTRLGNGGGNTNITFTAPKTVYWNQPAGGNWSDVAWALSSGGAVGANNFPLPQDAAILNNTGVGASTTIVMDYAWFLPTLNASSLTNALTINWNCFGNLSAGTLGDVTLSSAITITYTQGAWGVNALNSTSTITTAGVSIPIATVNFNAPSGTIKLGDQFTSTGTSVGLVAGTLDLNGYALFCNIFDGTFTDLLARTIAFSGGGIWLTGNNTTVWACENLTNFSYTGTPDVILYYTGGIGTRTISNGSTAGGTEANAVDFNVIAGSDTVSATAPSVVRNFTVQFAFTGVSNIFAGGTVYGNYLVHSGLTATSTASVITFAATSGTKTITTNGLSLFRNLTFDGVGGTWQLQDALDFGASGRNLVLTNGTFDANNYSVTGARVASSNSNVRTLKLGSATWTITAGTASGSAIEWNFTNITNLTVTGTGLIALTSDAIVIFQGGGRYWPGLVLDPAIAGAAPRWIYGSNTFGSITGVTRNYSVSFEAGTTQTVDNFTVSGTAGNLVTLNSLTPGTRWNIAKNTGTNVVVSYCSITDSAATPVGYWFAPTSQGNVDGGNNTGWNFTSAGQNSGFMMFL